MVFLGLTLLTDAAEVEIRDLRFAPMLDGEIADCQIVAIAILTALFRLARILGRDCSGLDLVGQNGRTTAVPPTRPGNQW